MNEAKRKRLEEAGWKIGSAADFLELSEEETALMDLKLALSQTLRERRNEHGLTQRELAKKLGSSQSRVAKMEASDPSVSLDLLFRALLALGASRRDVGWVIARAA